MTRGNRRVEIDGETWEIDEAGMLANSPGLSVEDSTAAWAVYAWLRRECRARGVPQPSDPISACVRLAFGTFIAETGGLDRGDETLQ